MDTSTATGEDVRESASTQVQVSGITHHWVIHQDMRIHAFSTGTGAPAVVTLHGVAGFGGSWLPFARALRGVGQVVAIDLPGHGESQWREPNRYRSEDHAEATAQLLDGMGLSATTLVGASWGGLVGLVVATSRPDLVARLVMIDLAPSSTRAVNEVPPRPASFRDHAEAAAFERNRFPDVPNETVALLASWGTVPGAGGAIRPRHDPFFDRMWPFRAEDHWSRLQALRQPVLVVRGANSHVLQAEDAERMAAAPGAGRLLTIADARHLVHIERPIELAAAVDDFIASAASA